jgi:amidase
MVGQQLANLGRLDAFGENLRGNVESGLTLTTTDIAKAERTRFALFQKMRGLFERYDLLLTPAAPVKPYPVEWNFPKEINGKSFDDYIDWIAPGFLITLMSLPAASVPAGLTADRLPVGLQIIGPRFEEPKILALAKLVQQANPIGWPPLAN